MRKLASMLLALFLLLVPVFVQRLNILPVRGSPDIHLGDLVLQGNNVTVIEGRFDINGSIIVEENATLILRNAVLNFTQSYSYQFHMNIQNPVDGNPRLIVENATMTTEYSLYVQSYANSSIRGDRLLAVYPFHFFVHDDSLVSLSNSSLYELYAYASTVVNTSDSYFDWLIGEGDSTITATNCTLVALNANQNATCTLMNCSIGDDVIVNAFSVNCSISQLQSGVVEYWNFGLNSSVIVAPGGWIPNVTLLNTEVYSWSFILGGRSNGTLSNCRLGRLGPEDSAVVYVYNSTNDGWIIARGSSSCYIYDTTIDMVEAQDNATSWLLNSTYGQARRYGSGVIFVNWYLDVHVVDQFNQDVPSANITAAFSNATQAESKLTDAGGWASLILMEKMMNATGDYPVGNYTVQATYGIHSNSTSVNMTGSKQATLKLGGFVIPEFPTLSSLPLFISATLLIALAYRRKFALK